jgi:hypothetical protein
MHSAALLQHCFLPTELIDLTDSLDVEGAFSAYKNNGKVGVLMAFPTKYLHERGLVIRGVAYSISSEARCWIEERIPWAPVPMRVDSVGTMAPAWDQF